MASLWRVSLAYVVYFSAVGASWPYLPVFYRSLGLDLRSIGALAATAAAMTLVAAPVWGALADRFPRTQLTLPAATLVAAGGALVVGTSSGLPNVALGVLVMSAGLAGVGPVLDARAIETLGADRIRYGQIRAVGSLAFVVAAWLVGRLIDDRGDAALFLAFVPTLLATAVVSATLVRRPASRSLGIRRGATVLVQTPGMRLFLIGAFLVWAALVAANAFYSIRIVALGGAAQLVGLAWAVGAAVEVPVMWFFPRLAVRYGTSRPLILGAAVFAIRAALAAAASDPIVLVAISPLEGLAFGLFYVGGVSFVAERAPSGLAATSQGVFQAMAGLASIAGYALGGVVAEALTIPGLFAVCSVAGAGAAIVVATAVRAAVQPTSLASTEVVP